MSGENVKNRWIILAGFLLVTILLPGVTVAYSCQADIDDDGTVNERDESLLDAEMGRDDCYTSPCVADLNNDGKVDSKDGEIFVFKFIIKLNQGRNLLPAPASPGRPKNH